MRDDGVLKISLSGEAAAIVRGELALGEYASANEVVEAALRSCYEPDVKHLRALWNEAMEHGGPGLDSESVKRHLREKFSRLAEDATGSKQR